MRPIADGMDVGRTNYAILAIGLASMLLMSMLMGHFLKLAKQHKGSPLVRELTVAFGERLDAESEFEVREASGHRTGVLTIYPMLGAGHERLAQTIGDFVWRRVGYAMRLDAVEVLCAGWGASPTRHPVPRPYMPVVTPLPHQGDAARGALGAGAASAAPKGSAGGHAVPPVAPKGGAPAPAGTETRRPRPAPPSGTKR